MEAVKFHSPDGTYVPIKSPLISVSAAQSILGCDSAKVNELAECGALLYVFDIRTRNAGKACLRIWVGSVRDYLAKEKTKGAKQQWREKQTDDAAIQSILPIPKVCVSAAVVARMFSCDSDHLYHLIKEGFLLEFTRRQPRQAAQISRASLIDFLKERRVW